MVTVINFLMGAVRRRYENKVARRILILAGSSLFAGVRLDVGVYAPPVPQVVYSTPYSTPCPGPGYVWIDGGWRLPHRDFDHRFVDRGRRDFRGGDHDRGRR